MAVHATSVRSAERHITDHGTRKTQPLLEGIAASKTKVSAHERTARKTARGAAAGFRIRTSKRAGGRPDENKHSTAGGYL
eukprot:4154522-Pleurochrysis_carterae.AAC.1